MSLDQSRVNVLICFRLDPDQKDALIEVIEKLLKDQTTVMAMASMRVK